jgi:hypothetical protein
MIRVSPCEPEHVEQLAALLSAHAACVVPGAAVSPDDVRSRLDHDAGEFVIDPWVRGRETLVSIERDRVVAAGQRWRFGADTYRGAAELRWYCFWPSHREAGAAVLDKAIADSASATRLYLSGDLPGPLVDGIPDAWEHVQELARARLRERRASRGPAHRAPGRASLARAGARGLRRRPARRGVVG